ncbi:hypothetical protein HDU96_007533, partial [Phlyctochytrium bullatum]
QTVNEYCRKGARFVVETVSKWERALGDTLPLQLYCLAHGCEAQEVETFHRRITPLLCTLHFFISSLSRDGKIIKDYELNSLILMGLYSLNGIPLPSSRVLPVTREGLNLLSQYHGVVTCALLLAQVLDVLDTESHWAVIDATLFFVFLDKLKRGYPFFDKMPAEIREGFGGIETALLEWNAGKVDVVFERPKAAAAKRALGPSNLGSNAFSVLGEL